MPKERSPRFKGQHGAINASSCIFLEGFSTARYKCTSFLSPLPKLRSLCINGSLYHLTPPNPNIQLDSHWMSQDFEVREETKGGSKVDSDIFSLEFPCMLLQWTKGSFFLRFWGLAVLLFTKSWFSVLFSYEFYKHFLLFFSLIPCSRLFS